MDFEYDICYSSYIENYKVKLRMAKKIMIQDFESLSEVIPKIFAVNEGSCCIAKMSHLVFLPAALLLISSTNAALKDDYDHSAFLDVAEISNFTGV